MRTVLKRCETRMVMRPSPVAVRGGGVALEERVLGLGVERGGRFVEHEHSGSSRMKPRASASFCHWPNDTSTPSGQVGPSCVSRPAARRVDDVVGAGPVDRADDGRLVVEARHVAHADRVPGAELEAKKSWKAPARSRAPRVGAACARAAVVDRIRPEVGS